MTPRTNGNLGRAAALACGMVAACGSGGEIDPDAGAESESEGPWVATSTVGAPVGRRDHAAVWTGSEMIVWGGVYGLSYYPLGDGGRYDPVADSWLPMAGAGAPEPRSGGVAVWARDLLLVWGGFSGSVVEPGGPLGDGARYDPAKDVWTSIAGEGAPSPRRGAAAVWSGAEMLVWGGWGGSDSGDFGDGARYDPATDIWSAIAEDAAPSPRQDPTAVWTGTEMVVWGGGVAGGDTDDGARYDSQKGAWTPMSSDGAPDPRTLASGVWTGSEMIVWGGAYTPSDWYTDGGRYDPVADTWTPVPAGEPREIASVVWAGSQMIVWGGADPLDPDGVDPYLATGEAYDPATGEWLPIPTEGAPTERCCHTAVWTGSEMIVWGGEIPGEIGTNTGARYRP